MTVASMFSLLALAVALVATACGQVFYKAYYMFAARKYLLFAVGFFLLAPVMSYFALQNLTIDAVYISTGLTHVLVLFLARVWLGERITREHVQGIVLVVAGLAIFAI